ncbi:hypothetical protein OTB20_05560 [Streptomyces sp. H27-H1]|uniref:hypothetical protein n=1 Tax=Streptomyces sp. H27-H1 TaxID=2996461 RepID=UPI00226E9F49|nr:hypothetical protein [Streptomyces sp. H27-H1]MCY0925678.1 hypothetical protein [Streptomyces sp. H27-H1]
MLPYDAGNLRRPPTAWQVAGRTLTAVLALLVPGVLSLAFAVFWSLGHRVPGPQNRRSGVGEPRTGETGAAYPSR